MAAAQFAVVERLSQQPDGSQKHPRLLEQYGYRARLTERYSGDAGAGPSPARSISKSYLQPLRRGARRS